MTVAGDAGTRAQARAGGRKLTMETQHTFIEAGERLPTGISVVVPVYNSEQTLETLLERLAAVLTACARAGGLQGILANDARPDRGWGLAGRACARYPAVRGSALL